MGNFISCSACISQPRNIRSLRTAKVVLPNGEIQEFHETTKAAELMLETPNYFLVNSCSLNIGRRFSALSADEDLEFGNVYIMLPMKRLNSMITTTDMEFLLQVSSGNIFKKLPEVAASASDATEDNLLENKVIGFSAEQEFRYRLSCRSRKPLLDTIVEEPVHSI